MPVIVVANPKGGVGKSTLATNLAGALTRQGHAPMLGDVDRQQSSRQWLRLRPGHLPAIKGWEIADGGTLKAPRGTTHVVLDTPAGLEGARLEQVLRIADRMLVPLQPSLFDIQATFAFVQALLQRRKPGQQRPALAIVGMRVKDHTIAMEQLKTFLDTLGVPVLGFLRDTQNYVHLAAHGLTLWDVAPSRVERDLPQWQPILDWVHAA
jgi:chromosome partitioning protein